MIITHEHLLAWLVTVAATATAVMFFAVKAMSATKKDGESNGYSPDSPLDAVTEIATARVLARVADSMKWWIGFMGTIATIVLGVVTLWWGASREELDAKELAKAAVRIEEAQPDVTLPAREVAGATNAIPATLEDTVQLAADDLKEFTFRVDTVGSYDITARGEEYFDPVVNLYHLDGDAFHRVATDDDSAGNLGSRICRTLQTGVYVLLVREIVGWPGKVTVSVNKSDCN